MGITFFIFYFSLWLKCERNPFWNCFSDTKFSDSICLYVCCYNNVFNLVWMQTCPQSISYKCKLLKQLLMNATFIFVKKKKKRGVWGGWRSCVITWLSISQYSYLVCEERLSRSNFTFLSKIRLENLHWKWRFMSRRCVVQLT